MKIPTIVLLSALLLPLPLFHGAALGLGPHSEPADAVSCPAAKVGEPAPDFKLDALLSTTQGKEFGKVSLKEYRGKWVVLFFYPADFTFVCPTEIKGFNQAIGEFQKLNAVVLG